MKVTTVIGARPQFIKSAPLSAEILKAGDIEESIIHTGQHYDETMSRIFFDELSIPEPKHLLQLGGGNHGRMTGRMLEAIEEIFVEENPNVVLVYGDTNSTLAGALAAVKLRIPVVHVEAGLRSGNFYQPEEINRVLTDQISKLLLCPSETAAENLHKENVTGQIEVVGDVMYDSTVLAAALAKKRGDNAVQRLGLADKKFDVLTMHRAENVDDKERFKKVLDYVRSISTGNELLFPIHPRTRARVEQFGLDISNLKVIEPVSYVDMIELISAAEQLITDSGGAQKEAMFCGTPCVTLRDETEWVETVESGWNRLWTVPEYTPRVPCKAFGDGKAAQAIVQALRKGYASGWK